MEEYELIKNFENYSVSNIKSFTINQDNNLNQLIKSIKNISPWKSINILPFEIFFC